VSGSTAQGAEDDRGATAADWLNSFRDHPEWTERERDQHFLALIARFSERELLAAAESRTADLTAADAEPIVRIIEAFGGPGDLARLAAAVSRQPELPAARSWEILHVLDGFGLIEATPGLADRWSELNDAFEQDDSLAELAHQIERDPDGIWLALEGLQTIEPDIRAEIVGSLARERRAGPGIVEFLRLLAFAHDPLLREAALRALEREPAEHPALSSAWCSIALDHHDPAIAARARERLGAVVHSLPAAVGPHCVRSTVTALDGRGVAHVAIVAKRADGWAAASFACDVMAGIVEVRGILAHEPGSAEHFFTDVATAPSRGTVEQAHDLAHALLAGALMLCRPSAPPALRYWLEQVLGPSVRPRLLAGLLPDTEPLSAGEEARRAEAILDASPDWIDDSALTYELAEEALLREGELQTESSGDVGAIRYLFEHRLRHRLELDRRMLCWMAALWHASGREELAQAAAQTAKQLADPAQAVPAQPFLTALAAKSLRVARENLRNGFDPRRVIRAD
jgi:hypothetical protein